MGQKDDEPPHAGAAIPASPLETTAGLLIRLREGDSAARDRLLARYLPILRRWAHGRLPASIRGLSETDDLVQITLVRALSHLEAFEPTREGAFLAYLRKIFLNSVRDQIRGASRRPVSDPEDTNLRDPSPSALEEVLGRETLERFEAALLELTEDQREAVILRVEFGYSYPQVAEAMGRPTANAARMLVTRGVAELARILAEMKKR